MFAAGSLDQHQDGQGLLLEYNRPASRAPRQQLARILIAYAALDSTVSYCQGMSSVAGMLLLAGIPEEMAFYCFFSLMTRFGLRAMYAPGFPALVPFLAAAQRLLARRHSKVAARLTSTGITADMFALPWFLTMFVNSPLPLSSAMTVLDSIVCTHAAGPMPPSVTEKRGHGMRVVWPQLREDLGPEDAAHVPTSMASAFLALMACYKKPILAAKEFDGVYAALKADAVAVRVPLLTADGEESPAPPPPRGSPTEQLEPALSSRRPSWLEPKTHHGGGAAKQEAVAVAEAPVHDAHSVASHPHSRRGSHVSVNSASCSLPRRCSHASSVHRVETMDLVADLDPVVAILQARAEAVGRPRAHSSHSDLDALAAREVNPDGGNGCSELRLTVPDVDDTEAAGVGVGVGGAVDESKASSVSFMPSPRIAERARRRSSVNMTAACAALPAAVVRVGSGMRIGPNGSTRIVFSRKGGLAGAVDDEWSLVRPFEPTIATVKLADESGALRTQVLVDGRPLELVGATHPFRFAKVMQRKANTVVPAHVEDALAAVRAAP